MPITPTTLVSGLSTVNSSVFVTTTYTPSSNTLVLAAIAQLSTTPTLSSVAPVLEGNGATWVRIGNQEQASTLGGAAVLRHTLWRSMISTPVAGATTIRFTSAVGSCHWAIAEFSGVSTESTEGAAAVIQVLGAVSSTSAAALTVSLAPFANSSNVAYGSFVQQTSADWTTGAGFTKLSSARVPTAAEGMALMTEFQINTTAVTATGQTTAEKRAIGLEIGFPALAIDEFHSRRKMVGVGR